MRLTHHLPTSPAFLIYKATGTIQNIFLSLYCYEIFCLSINLHMEMGYGNVRLSSYNILLYSYRWCRCMLPPVTTVCQQCLNGSWLASGVCLYPMARELVCDSPSRSNKSVHGTTSKDLSSCKVCHYPYMKCH